ncbi:MAG: hypothetical protein RIK87_06390 [Fuerstiella sp.]
MKTVVVWSLVLWFALVCEQARPELFLSGSLVIPTVVGCLFWLRNGTGMLLAGSVLLLSWTLRTQGPPVEVIVVLLMSARLLTGRPRRGPLERQAARRMLPVLVCVLGETALCLSGLPTVDLSECLSALVPRLMMAVPAAAVIVFLGHLCEELGLRRTVTV